MQLTDLETPALVLDRNILDRNIARMREHLTDLRMRLRPHVKTAKSMDVVRRALDGQPGGITVSTLKEAEQFFAAGFSDILYAVGMAPNKFAQALALRQQGCDLKLITDNVDMARALGRFKTSMHQDLEAGKALEIDGLLAGTLEIARKAGVRAPYTESLFGLVKARAISTNQYRKDA